MNFEKIAVIGAGIMGHGIAQIMAQGGKTVVLNDISEAVLIKAENKIKESLELLVNNALLEPEAAKDSLARISYSANLECVADADLIFEVVPEKLHIKEDIFKKLAGVSKPGAVWATNTSGMPINQLAGLTDRPQLFVGTHFFQPAHLVPLVEVIQGAATNINVIHALMELLKEVGKSPVHVKMDIPGFIGNRLQHAIAREAMSLLEKGVASAEDIDTVVRTSLAVRMIFTGPIQQRDFNGLDTHLSIAEYLYKDLENSTAPLKILADKVAANNLGLKTGQGFYDWRTQVPADVTAKKNQELIDITKFLKTHK